MPQVRVSTNPVIDGLRSKVNARMQQIARYRISGKFTDSQIGPMVGITREGVKRIVSTPEYQELEKALLKEHVAGMDAALRDNIDKLRDDMRKAVPEALQTMVDAVRQRKDLRSALKAADMILDRDPDGTFASRSAPASGSGGTAAFDPARLGQDVMVTVTQAVQKFEVGPAAPQVQVPPQAQEPPTIQAQGD